MEKKLITIITDMINNNRLQKLYDEEASSFDFQEEIDINKITFNILHDFSFQHFETYKSILVENAFIYSCLNNDIKFKKHFIKSLDDLDNKIYDDIFFQLKICEYGIKHIFNKDKNINIDESNVRNEYKDVIDSLNNKYTKVYSITNIYRKFIINYLKEHFEDYEIILDTILTSSKLDNELISLSNGLLTKDNINTFKTVLYRLILTDNYIYLENVLSCDDEYDDLFENELEYNESFKDYSDDYDEEFDEEMNQEELIEEININILNFIKECIQDNTFKLPSDDEIRYNLYSIFFTYNDYNPDRKFDIENISDSKENIKTLKKLNPLYLMDLIDGKIN